MTKHKTKAYPESFRKEAVRLADLPDRTAMSVAEELGIHSGQIYNWRNQFKRLSGKQFNTLDGVKYSKDDSDELRVLKKKSSSLERSEIS